jgi:hypothetical protein
MGRLNGRDRSFQKGNRGVHRIARAPEGASVVINHAGSAHAVVTRITERAGTAIAVHGNACGAMRRNFTVRLFRENAKPAWQPTKSRVDSTAKRDSNAQTKSPQSGQYRKYKPTIRMLWAAPRYLGSFRTIDCDSVAFFLLP